MVNRPNACPPGWELNELELSDENDVAVVAGDGIDDCKAQCEVLSCAAFEYNELDHQCMLKFAGQVFCSCPTFVMTQQWRSRTVLLVNKSDEEGRGKTKSKKENSPLRVCARRKKRLKEKSSDEDSQKFMDLWLEIEEDLAYLPSSKAFGQFSKCLKVKKLFVGEQWTVNCWQRGEGGGKKNKLQRFLFYFLGKNKSRPPPPARSFTVRFFRFYVFFHRPTSQRTKTKEATTCSGGTTQRLGKHSPSPRRCGDKAGQWTLQEYIHHHQISALVPAQKPTQHVGKPFRVRQARRIGPRLFTLKKGIIKFYFHGRKFFFPLPWSFF